MKKLTINAERSAERKLSMGWPWKKEEGKNTISSVPLVRIGVVILSIVVLAFSAQILWAAASAGIAIGVLAIMALFAFGFTQMIPFFGQKLENRILKNRKEEARKNPIEQLQNYLLDKAAQVKAFKEAVGQIGAQIKSMEDMLSNRKRQRPDRDTSKQEASLMAMKQAHAALVAKYKAAEKALHDLTEVIEDKKFEWKFAQAGQQAMQSLSAASGEDLLAQMLADEAFDSVRDNFNQVFADLEMEATKLNSAKQLTFGNDDDRMVIDISAVHIPQLQPSRS